MVNQATTADMGLYSTRAGMMWAIQSHFSSITRYKRGRLDLWLSLAWNIPFELRVKPKKKRVSELSVVII